MAINRKPADSNIFTDLLFFLLHLFSFISFCVHWDIFQCFLWGLLTQMASYNQEFCSRLVADGFTFSFGQHESVGRSLTFRVSAYSWDWLIGEGIWYFSLGSLAKRTTTSSMLSHSYLSRLTNGVCQSVTFWHYVYWVKFLQKVWVIEVNLAGKMGSNPKVIGSSFELVGFYCGGKKLSFSLITPSIKIILKKYLNNS